MRGVEAHRQIEYGAIRAALHRKERIDRDPLDLVEKSELDQNRVLGLARVVRIGRLMERRLDREGAGLEGDAAPPTL